MDEVEQDLRGLKPAFVTVEVLDLWPIIHDLTDHH